VSSVIVCIQKLLILSSFRATDEEREIFQRILDLVPTFEEVLLEFVEEPDLLGQFISKVSEYMRCLLY
jgi:Asp-tRNA(Asn)/Glu-tRNA(Gln) amidotransferase C subunit